MPARSPWNVLVWPGGTEIGLEINASLASVKEVRLFSAGLDTLSHAPYVYARHFVLPSVHEPTWLDKLQELIARQRLDFIIPAHDDVLLALSENTADISAGVTSSPHRTCEICRSKSLTYETLADVVPVPHIYREPREIQNYPVFVKPDRGQGSQLAFPVYSRVELEHVLARHPTMLIMELLPGEEFTIDCFTDRECGLLYCAGRSRLRVRSGIAVTSRPVSNELFHTYALAISSRLELHGAWFFQMKMDAAGELKLLEVSPRIPGTSALDRVRGINLPLLSLYEHVRSPISIMANPVQVEVDRALVNRYQHNVRFDVVYVDLDDTLIVRAHVNTLLIRFLYQCINMRKRLVLLTRHAEDVHETLRHYRIDRVFDEIIHLPRWERKVDFMRGAAAILIDDSFAERKEAFEEAGILTFDCSMIEMLLDERQ